MGIYAHTFFSIDIERPALPKAEAWYARLKARPSFASIDIPLT